VSRSLLSPRAPVQTLGDFGERSAFVAGQQVGARARRPRRAAAVGNLARRVVVGLLLAVIPVAVGAAGWWILTSSRFGVTSVEVHGAHLVSAERILEAAQIPSGRSLFLLDPGRIARQIEALPEVQRAEVIRELPNRVTVMVEERKPFTLVHAGRLHWIDESGHVLGREAHAVTPPAPVISGLTEAELLSMRAAPNGKARDAIRLIRALLRSGSALAAEISEIDMRDGDGPVLYTVNGVEVRLGAEDWEERLARLEGVLAQQTAADGHIRSVDLRFRDQVVLRGGR
jgi:cell division septal protein FtsQ